MTKLTCWICSEHPECPYDCKEQIERSKQIAKEWDDQKAMTQEDIEEQLKLNLGDL